LPSTWSLTGVRLGEWDTATDVDCDDSFVNEKVCNDPPVDIPIELKIPHEQYDPQGANQHVSDEFIKNLEVKKKEK
jgi:hypothetical protein